MKDKYEPTIYRGCKNCPNAPQTFEEYCLSKCCPEKICPDAYTEVAYHCNNYEHTATEERELNELGLIPKYKGHWIIYKSLSIKLRQCSVCKVSFPYYMPRNYCPNCGADMRGDE